MRRIQTRTFSSIFDTDHTERTFTIKKYTNKQYRPLLHLFKCEIKQTFARESTQDKEREIGICIRKYFPIFEIHARF